MSKVAPIWFNQSLAPQHLNALAKGNMAEYVGIEITEVGENYLKARMPVDHRTKQPYGLLHGGASCVLSETLGSLGAAMVVNYEENFCVGLEINANHIRSARGGFVTGIASPIHIGRSTQVWETKIYDEQEKLVCVSRLTVAVMKKEK